MNKSDKIHGIKGGPSWVMFWLIGGAVLGSSEVIANAFFNRFPLVFGFFVSSPFWGIILNYSIYLSLYIVAALAAGILAELFRRIFKAGYSVHIFAGLALLCALIAYLGHGIEASDLGKVLPPAGISESYRPLSLWVWLGVGAILFLASGSMIIKVSRRMTFRTAEYWLVPVALGAVLFNIFDRSSGLWPFRLILFGIVVLVSVGVGGVLARLRPRLGPIIIGIFTATLLAVFLQGIYYGWPGKDYDSHLILMVWDAQRADTMSVYNDDLSTTPNLESWRDHMIIFRQAYSPANYTFASHVSILTGRYLREHHLYDGTESDRASYGLFENMADTMIGRGYRPLFMVENPWVMVLKKGFNEAVNCPTHVAAEGHFLPFYRNPFLGIQLFDHLTFLLDGPFKYTVLRIEDRVLTSWLLRARREGPYYLFFNWMYAHSRYYPGCNPEKDGFAEGYNKGTEFMDLRLKGWIDSFEEARQFSRSLFLITSDHGELLGEWEMYGHAKTLLEPVLHVPLILFGKPVTPEVIKTPVPVVSLKESIEALVPSAPGQPWRVQGFIDTMLHNRGTVVEGSFDFEGPDNGIRWFLACWEGNNKYMQDPHEYIPGHSKGLDMESFCFYYDLDADPGEKNNQARHRPQEVLHMQEAIAQWESRLDAVPLPPPAEGEEGEYPPGLLKQLRALGYMR